MVEPVGNAVAPVVEPVAAPTVEVAARVLEQVVAPMVEQVAPPVEPVEPAAAVVAAAAPAFTPVVVPLAEAVTLGIVAAAPEAARADRVGDGAAPESLATAPLIVPVSDLEALVAEATAPVADKGEGAVENAFTNAVAVNDFTGQRDGNFGVNRLDASDSDSDSDPDAPPVVEQPLTLGDPETIDGGVQGLSPFASGLLARVAPFDPAVFELAMQKVVGRLGGVGDLGEELVGSLEGPGLFSLEQPSLLSWLMAAAVAACAYEMARRKMEKSQAEQALPGHGHGPTAMWFPGPPGQ
jgi:hypothetical protein